jgi:hypothetical protein
MILAVACSAPSPPVSVATATPTVASTTSPQQPSVAPSASATAIAAIVSGAVYWNHHPQAGLTVEISQVTAQRRVALASGTTLADGSFSVAYSGPTSSAFGAYVPAGGPYLEGGRPATLARGSDQRVVFVTDPIDLVRAITGLSVHDRDTFPPGPLTITWDAVPEATAYCITVYSPSMTNQTPAPRCSTVAHLPGDLVTSNRYTTKALAPDQYTIAVVAITDVAIAELPPTGIAFRVVP